MATFDDDTAILTAHVNPNTAGHELQDHLSNLQEWMKKCWLKVDENKLAHINFTLKKKTRPAVTLIGFRIPSASDVKYQGMHLDRKLT